MADEVVKVTLIGDARRFTADMKQAATSMSKVDKAAESVTKQMTGMAKGFALAAATTVAVDQLKEAVGMAVNLQDSISKVGVVFGTASNEVMAFADDVDRSFGLTKTAALDAMSTFAIFGKAAGLTGSELTKFSEDLTQRAVDLKSFYGGSVEEAITAVGAALRGESEPIRAYGVLLDDATLKARALTMGLIENTKSALTPQTRALAAQAEIMDQTSMAANDYKNTQDGAANALNDFTVAWGRLKEEFGTGFLPGLSEGAGDLAKLIGLLTKGKEAFDQTTGGDLNLGPFFYLANIPNFLGPLGQLVQGFDALGISVKGLLGPFGSLFAGFEGMSTIWGGLLGPLAGLIGGSDDAADSTENLGSASAAAKLGVDKLGSSASGTASDVQSMVDPIKAASDALNGFIDAQQGLRSGRRDLAGIGSDIRDAMRQPGTRSSGGGGGSSGESKAESAARQKVIDKIREQDQAEQESEIKRARRRAQRRADAAADKRARRDTQSGVKGAIDTDKAARAGKDIDGSNQRGTVGEATGSLSKAQQKSLDKEIEGIRARHKKALDAQLKGLQGAQKAARATATATDTYSTSLNENTAAGRRNLDQLDRGIDLVQRAGIEARDAALAQGKTAEEAARAQGAAMLKARESLIDQYKHWGFNTAAVEAYLKQVGLIPKTIKTTYKVDADTSEAKRKLDEYAKWVKKHHPELNSGEAAAAATRMSRADPNFATGGEIHGQGGPRSDTVPIWASPGEFMVNAQQYAANRDLVRAINNGRGAVSGGGMNIGQVTVNETSPARVRSSVIDALTETAYRTGAVR